MARKTRVEVLGATRAAPVITRDTVAVETRASLATSRIPILYPDRLAASWFSVLHIEEIRFVSETLEFGPVSLSSTGRTHRELELPTPHRGRIDLRATK